MLCPPLQNPFLSESANATTNSTQWLLSSLSFLSLSSLSLSLSLSHTHTHIQTCTNKLTNTPHTLPQPFYLSQKYIFSLSLSHTHTHSLSRSLSLLSCIYHNTDASSITIAWPQIGLSLFPFDHIFSFSPTLPHPHNGTKKKNCSKLKKRKLEFECSFLVTFFG